MVPVKCRAPPDHPVQLPPFSMPQSPSSYSPRAYANVFYWAITSIGRLMAVKHCQMPRRVQQCVPAAWGVMLAVSPRGFGDHFSSRPRARLHYRI